MFTAVFRIWAAFALLLILTARGEARATRTGSILPDRCKELLQVPERQALRKLFIQQYAEATYTTARQNQTWIDRSLSQSRRARFYIVMENAWLKQLNDKILRDKDLVTALTHLHKELFLDELRSGFSDLSFRTYSDFKSVRLEVAGAFDDELFARFQQAFQQTNQNFRQHSVLKQILREEDLSSSPLWFALGTGSTADEASLAARGARRVDHRSLSFSDPEFQRLLQQELIRVRELYAEVLSLAQGSSLLESDTALDLQVYVLARKAQNAEALLEELRMEYPDADLSLGLAEHLLELIELSDHFSPSMLIAQRETLTLHEAPFGALSMDFIGLGGENLKATTEALAEARNIAEALRLARAYEREVTQRFTERKRQVENVLQEYFDHNVQIKFSGDDAVIVPGREFLLREQLFLVRKLAALYPRSYFRMSLLSHRSAQSDVSAQIMTHAEGIEKILRTLVQSHLGPEINRLLSLKVFILDEGLHRKVVLLLNARMEFNEYDREIMKQIFKMAVRRFERTVRDQGEDLSYEALDIYATFPSTPHPPE